MRRIIPYVRQNRASLDVECSPSQVCRFHDMKRCSERQQGINSTRIILIRSMRRERLKSKVELISADRAR